jgi:outer membrane protein assembly factor BamB
MNPIWLVVGLIALAVLGLFVAGAGVLTLRKGGRPAQGAFFVLFGLVALGFAGATGWHNWPLIMQLFQQDVDDPEAQARLRTKTLGGDRGGPADDWPQWRGPHRDGISADTGLLTEWPKDGPRRVWRAPIGGGYSSPSVAGGRVYVTDKQGSEERVRCLDANRGKERWSYAYEVDYTGMDPGYAKGPRATPAIHDGRVYTLGASGVFLCLEAAPQGDRARLLWRHDLLSKYQAKLPKWGVASSPLVVGGLIIVQPGGNKGSVVAFDRVTGQEKWTALDDSSGYSSPVAATAAGAPQVICFTARRMVGLRVEDGGLLWEFGWRTPNDANIATPLVADDYVFLSSDYGAGCALLELKAQGDGGVSARPVFVRRNKVMRNQSSTCVLHNNHLYGFDVAGYGDRVFLRCVDVRTFEEKWNEPFVKDKASLLFADGHLLVLTEEGVLSLVEATPAGYRKKASAEVLDGSQCWALPALAGGRLYLRDNKYIVCLEMKK